MGGEALRMRKVPYGLVAAVLSLGAPAGLAVVRSLRAWTFSLAWVRADAEADWSTYLYVLLSTGLVFSVFGHVLGRHLERLSDASTKDPLTGLRNRGFFQERLEEEFTRAARHDTALSVLIVDLDGLKEVNDTLGHRAGDQALRRVAAALRGGSRATDIVARWGGDEFVLLAPDTPRQEALSLAERIRELASIGARPAGHGVTVSVGVATFGGGGTVHTPDALVRTADVALYQAKRAGRNRVVIS